MLLLRWFALAIAASALPHRNATGAQVDATAHHACAVNVMLLLPAQSLATGRGVPAVAAAPPLATEGRRSAGSDTSWTEKTGSQEPPVTTEPSNRPSSEATAVGFCLWPQMCPPLVHGTPPPLPFCTSDRI